MKTHSGAKHRFRVTGTGKFMRSKGNRRHLKTGKSKRVLRQDQYSVEVASTHTKKLKRLLPYGVA